MYGANLSNLHFYLFLLSTCVAPLVRYGKTLTTDPVAMRSSPSTAIYVVYCVSVPAQIC